MRALTATLRSLPHTQYRKNPYFYLWYDSMYALLFAGLIAALHRVGAAPLVPTFRLWHVALVVPVIYVTILAHVFIHNASHGNFGRTFNRVVGELLGVVVLTRFASWEVIHQRHHQYSDDLVRDPHPVIPSYFRYLFRTLRSVEAQLATLYLDTFGDTPTNRRIERVRSAVSAVAGVLLIGAWYQVLGPIGFFVFMAPATVASWMFIVHFNWCTHNAGSATGDYHPVDLDTGYYYVGNRLFFGIYYHAQHHLRARLFNPMNGRHLPQRAEQAPASGDLAA